MLVKLLLRRLHWHECEHSASWSILRLRSVPFSSAAPCSNCTFHAIPFQRIRCKASEHSDDDGGQIFRTRIPRINRKLTKLQAEGSYLISFAERHHTRQLSLTENSRFTPHIPLTRQKRKKERQWFLPHLAQSYLFHHLNCKIGTNKQIHIYIYIHFTSRQDHAKKQKKENEIISSRIEVKKKDNTRKTKKKWKYPRHFHLFIFVKELCFTSTKKNNDFLKNESRVEFCMLTRGDALLDKKIYSE